MVDRREAELIERAQKGHDDAFEELLRPVLRDAARLAYGMLQDYCEAEDRVQEASERAYRRLRNVRSDGSFRSWFLAIVANRCREARRDRWWLLMRSADREREISRTEPDWLEAIALREALATLPHDKRLTIVLYFYLDLPLEEVAAMLGIGIAGVRSRIDRAKRDLRSALDVAR